MIRERITKQYSSAGRHVNIEGFRRGHVFVPHGDVKIAYNDGKPELTGRYVNGAPSGIWRRWYENATLQSEHAYVNGVLNGAHRQYWDNGILAREGVYRLGPV